MRILVLSMNYAPERTTVGPYVTELAEHLARVGHAVSVVTAFPHYPEWDVYPPYRGRLCSTELISGIPVHRGYVFVPRRQGVVRRVLYDVSFSISALLWGLLLREPVDAILAVSPPLQLGVTGYLLSKVKRARFVFQMQDLVPDAAISLGLMRNSAAIRLARALERFVYRRADALLVIAGGFVDNLSRKGVPPAKVHLLPDWIDTEVIYPSCRRNTFREELGCGGDDFLVTHLGNMGAKQGLLNLVEAANLLREDSSLHFILVGGGSEKPDLQRKAADLGLRNLHFLDVQPKERLNDVLAAADVLLLNQKARVVDMSMPSKLLSYMAAGRPVLAAVNPLSEAARCLRQADCGVLVEPESPGELARAIDLMRREPRLLSDWGQKARAYVQQHYSRSIVLRQFEAFFCRLEARSSSFASRPIGPFETETNDPSLATRTPDV